MNGASTGFVAGAASGAASGAMVGSVVPVVGTAIGAAAGVVIGGALGYFSGASADAQQSSSAAWAQYNADQSRAISTQNANSSMSMTAFNAGMIMSQSDTSIAMSQEEVAYNVSMIQTTTQYNDLLMEEDLSLMWESYGLDSNLLDMQRNLERGNIVVNQGASGTIIGEGSNADVLMSQKTMAELDSFVLLHNADIQAANITNARAQSKWQGDVAIAEAEWRGEMSQYATRTSSNNQASAMLLGALMDRDSAGQSIDFSHSSASNAVSQNIAAGDNQNTNNMVSSLFSTAGQAGGSMITDSANTKATEMDQTVIPGRM